MPTYAVARVGVLLIGTLQVSSTVTKVEIASIVAELGTMFTHALCPLRHQNVGGTSHGVGRVRRNRHKTGQSQQQQHLALHFFSFAIEWLPNSTPTDGPTSP